MGKAGTCKCWFCVGVIAVPAILLGILIGVYYPKAPGVAITSESINSFAVNGMVLDADVTLTVQIHNQNVFPLSIDPMNITVAFPDAPMNIIGQGVIDPGTLPKQGTAIRGADIKFSASFATLGFSFLKQLQSGTTQLLVRTKARGVAPFLAQRSRFTSTMVCIVTYYWDSREADHNCSEKHSIEV